MGGASGRPLGKDGPHSHIGCIHLHDEGLESDLCKWSPAEGHLGGHEGCERGADGAVVSDELVVEFDEPQEPLQLLVGVRNLALTKREFSRR